MEEEDALSDAPERSGAELIRAGAALGDAVRKTFAHVMDEKVREEIRRLIGKRSARDGRGAAGNHSCPWSTKVCGNGRSPPW